MDRAPGGVRGEPRKVILPSLRWFYMVMIYGVLGSSAQGTLTGRADQEAPRAGRATGSVIYAAARSQRRPHFLPRIDDFNPGILVRM